MFSFNVTIWCMIDLWEWLEMIWTYGDKIRKIKEIWSERSWEASLTCMLSSVFSTWPAIKFLWLLPSLRLSSSQNSLPHLLYVEIYVLDLNANINSCFPCPKPQFYFFLISLTVHPSYHPKQFDKASEVLITELSFYRLFGTCRFYTLVKPFTLLFILSLPRRKEKNLILTLHKHQSNTPLP